MKYLRVKNWEKFQFPSEKPLPWIKFWTALLAPTKEPWYSELPDALKAHLHHIWLMARVFNNRIPEDWLTKERLNLNSKLSLNTFLDVGAIWWEDSEGSRLSTPLRARIARSGVSESSLLGSPEGVQGEINQPAEFERLWSEIQRESVPKPLGRKTALRYFEKSVSTKQDVADIWRALEAYRTSAEVGRGFVQHAKTWFNNWRDHLPTAQPVEQDGNVRRDAIREAALTLRGALRITDEKQKQWSLDVPIADVREYLQWLAPDGQMRDDALPLDEWRAQQQGATVAAPREL